MSEIWKFAYLVFVSLLAACATEKTIELRPIDEGISQTFSAPYRQVVTATEQAVSRLAVDVRRIREFGRATTLEFSKPSSAWSSGEVGRVAVLRSADDQTMVVVTAEKRSQVQITGTSEAQFARLIFAGIADSLRGAKSD